MSILYLAHFGLYKPPFQITPNLDFFFAGGHRGDVLAALLHVAANDEGIVTLIAEVGSGKTMLARLMISQLEPHISTVYLANPSFSRDEILGAIARDLGLRDLPSSTEGRLSALQHELLRRHSLGERVLLVIDEAHSMPPESLEEVRLLSNLETGQHKLVNIMLFGQPELDELLADRRMRQVRDRVVHNFKLQPLAAEDVRAYVDHRLRAAGWKGGPIFSASAMALLVKASGGRARRINLLADKALLASYAQGLSVVKPRQVQEAMRELHDDFASVRVMRVPAWSRWAAFSLVLAVCLTLLAIWLLDLRRVDNTQAVTVVDQARVPVVAVETTQPPVSAVISNAQRSASGAEPLVTLASAPAPAPIAPSTALPDVTAPTTPSTPTSPSDAGDAGDAGDPSAITPAIPPALHEALQPYLAHTREHLRQSGAAGYAVQLAALPITQSALIYLQQLSQYIDSAIIFVQLSRYNERNYVSVFVGHFNTLADAKAAMAGWPPALKSNKPIVRTWQKIKEEQLI